MTPYRNPVRDSVGVLVNNSVLNSIHNLVND